MPRWMPLVVVIALHAGLAVHATRHLGPRHREPWEAVADAPPVGTRVDVLYKDARRVTDGRIAIDAPGGPLLLEGRIDGLREGGRFCAETAWDGRALVVRRGRVIRADAAKWIVSALATLGLLALACRTLRLREDGVAPR